MLARDFRAIKPDATRVVLVEGGPRVLAAFDPELSERATPEPARDGRGGAPNARVTAIDEQGVAIGADAHRGLDRAVGGRRARLAAVRAARLAGRSRGPRPGRAGLLGARSPGGVRDRRRRELHSRGRDAAAARREPGRDAARPLRRARDRASIDEAAARHAFATSTRARWRRSAAGAPSPRWAS